MSVILTASMIHAHCTERGGWTKAQLSAIGIDWPPIRGWIDKVAGSLITDEQWQEFISGRSKFVT